MAVKNFSLLAALALSGCAIFDPIDDMLTLNEQAPDTELAEIIDDGSTFASSVIFQNQFKQDELATATESRDSLLEKNAQNATAYSKDHDINYYVRGMMQDLVANLQYVNSTTPVAVVSFVMLNSNYNDSNLLGIQIAESLIHEVHKFGIPVIDFKTTGFIRVTEQGDFAFSKDYEDFTGEMPARYIVGGTMLKHTDGYLINARIVGMQSQAVVASAQSFIPNSVSDPILMMSAAPKSSNRNGNVQLGRVAFPLGFDSSLVTQKNENLMNRSQPMDNIAKNSSSNNVSLIQE
jgi:TolB-like protein